MTKRQDTEHRKAVVAAQRQIDELDRHRCHYTIDGMRCTATGTICDTAQWDENVKDPFRRWLCITHYRLRGDHLGSREALHDLAAHPHHPKEDWREKRLNEHGLEEFQIAWRDMDPEDKQALIDDTIRKAKNLVSIPVDLNRLRGSGTGGYAVGQTVNVPPEELSRQLEALYRAMTPAERAEYDERLARGRYP